MLTASKLIPAGRGLAAVLLKRASTLLLDWDVRQKSRFEATDSAGRSIGVFLSRGTAVRGGDVLLAEDGSLIRVLAAPQPVMVIRHCPEHGTAFDLTRAAYHLGNRHVAIELQPDHLKIEPDPVLAEMLGRMHLLVNETLLPFDPEGGAYAAGTHAHGGHHEHTGPASQQPGHDHGHDHGDHHGHQHGHGHDHGHEHHHSHGHSHDHGHSHGHDHQPAPTPAAGHAQVHDHTHHDPGHGHSHEPVQGHVHGPGCQHKH
ncbi:MAG: urease accessory protein UreE [Rubrivivax sp.]|nr:urease accessory protein UreE [Rubrivivax sp.]